MKPASTLSAIALSAVAVVHATRLVLGIEVIAAGTVVPMWISIFGTVIPAALAIGLWRGSRSR